MARIAASAAPVAIGTPNLLSRMPVVVFSCVCPSTPGETRSSTRWVFPAALAAASTRATSVRLSMTIRPTPASTASASSSGPLLLPWK
jgi:hypothetical protein